MTTYHYISEETPQTLLGVWLGDYFTTRAMTEQELAQAYAINPQSACGPVEQQTASLTFPSGACVQLAGDKIVGRIAPEPVRAPLDWNTTTRHDTFGPDFIVTKGEVPTAPLYDTPTTDSAYPAIAGLLRG